MNVMINMLDLVNMHWTLNQELENIHFLHTWNISGRYILNYYAVAETQLWQGPLVSTSFAELLLLLCRLKCQQPLWSSLIHAV